MGASAATRCLLIGCGRAALHHATALKATNQRSQLFVIGSSIESGQRFAERHGGLAFASVGEAADAVRPLIAIVATPPGPSFEYARQCLSRGISVLIEKPGPRPSEMLLLSALARAGRERLAVGYVLRHNSAHRFVREALVRQRFGALRAWADVRTAFRPALERRWWAELPGGLLAFQGCHALDLILWMTGDRVRVTDYTESAWSETKRWNDTFVLRGNTLRSSVPISVTHSFCASEAINALILEFTTGELRIDDFQRVSFNGRVLFESEPAIAIEEAFKAQLLAFTAAGRTATDLCSARQAYATARTIAEITARARRPQATRAANARIGGTR